jgi:hypothetical protein
MKKYTWLDYWRSLEGMSLFFVSRSYRDIYPWWHRSRYRVGGKLPDMWHYVKCRLWKRYTTVTPRSLPPTWCDRDHLILHANFEILMDFVENELPHSWSVKDLEAEIAKEVAPGDWQQEQSRAWCESALPSTKEIEFLYHWWTVLRPAREAEYDRRLMAWSELHQRQRSNYTEANPSWQKTDNPHLHRYSLPEDAPEPEGLAAAHKAMREMDDEIRDAEDNAMLKRLIDIRGYLWT